MTTRQCAGLDAMHREPTLCGWTRATREDVLHHRLNRIANDVARKRWPIRLDVYRPHDLWQHVQRTTGDTP